MVTVPPSAWVTMIFSPAFSVVVCPLGMSVTSQSSTSSTGVAWAGLIAGRSDAPSVDVVSPAGAGPGWVGDGRGWAVW